MKSPTLCKPWQFSIGSSLQKPIIQREKEGTFPDMIAFGKSMLTHSY